MGRLPRVLERILSVVAVFWVAGIVIVMAVVFFVAGDHNGYPSVPLPISLNNHTLIDIGTPQATRPLDYIHVTASEGLAQIEFPPGVGGDAALAAVLLITLVPGLIIVELLRNMFRLIASGQPFGDKVSVTVRRVGVTMLAYYGLRAGVGIATWLVVAPIMGSHGVSTGPGWVDPVGFFLSLAVIALAQVFRYGTQLQADAELTV